MLDQSPGAAGAADKPSWLPANASRRSVWWIGSNTRSRSSRRSASTRPRPSRPRPGARWLRRTGPNGGGLELRNGPTGADPGMNVAFSVPTHTLWGPWSNHRARRPPRGIASVTIPRPMSHRAHRSWAPRPPFRAQPLCPLAHRGAAPPTSFHDPSSGRAAAARSNARPGCRSETAVGVR